MSCISLVYSFVINFLIYFRMQNRSIYLGIDSFRNRNITHKSFAKKAFLVQHTTTLSPFAMLICPPVKLDITIVLVIFWDILWKKREVCDKRRDLARHCDYWSGCKSWSLSKCTNNLHSLQSWQVCAFVATKSKVYLGRKPDCSEGQHVLFNL